MEYYYEENEPETRYRKLEETLDRYEKELFDLFKTIHDLSIEEQRILGE